MVECSAMTFCTQIQIYSILFYFLEKKSNSEINVSITNMIMESHEQLSVEQGACAHRLSETCAKLILLHYFQNCFIRISPHL